MCHCCYVQPVCMYKNRQVHSLRSGNSIYRLQLTQMTAPAAVSAHMGVGAGGAFQFCN